MISKKQTLGIVSIFILLLVMSFASAAITLQSSGWAMENITHGTSETINIEVEADANWDLYNISTSINVLSGSFSEDNVEVRNFNSIENGTTGVISLEVSVPKHKAPGQYELEITFDGYENNATNESDLRQLNNNPLFYLDIDVPESPSLSVSDSSFTGNTTTITVKNQGNIELTEINLTYSGSFDINFSENDFDLIAGEEKEITLTFDSDFKDLKYGDNLIVVSANSSNEDYAEGDVIYNKGYAGEISNLAELEFDELTFSVEKGLGEETKIYPFDEVKIETTLNNKGNYMAEDIEIKTCLYDIENDECVLDEEDMEINEDDFDLEEGKDMDLEILFTLDARKISETNDDYYFLISAEGELEGDKAEEENVDGEKTATSTLKNLNVKLKDYLVIENLDLSESIPCDSEIQFRPKIWNIGDSKIPEDEIFIKVENEELEISEVVEFDEGISALSSSNFDVLIKIPEGVEEKIYSITFTVYDDKDMEEKDIYEGGVDDDKAIYTSDINVTGLWCEHFYDNVKKSNMIDASIKKGRKSGDEFVLNVTITNPEDEQVTFGLEDIEANWTESISVSSSQITLDVGESENIEITLQSKEDISGKQIINWNIGKDGVIVAEFELPIEVKGSKGIQDWDWEAILNVVLVIAIISIIIVIISLATKKSKKKKTLKKKNQEKTKKEEKLSIN